MVISLRVLEVCVCVCERERQTDRQTLRERPRERWRYTYAETGREGTPTFFLLPYGQSGGSRRKWPYFSVATCVRFVSNHR